MERFVRLNIDRCCLLPLKYHIIMDHIISLYCVRTLKLPSITLFITITFSGWEDFMGIRRDILRLSPYLLERDVDW